MAELANCGIGSIPRNRLSSTTDCRNSWKYEQVQILIQLAELIQQRVNELESQLKKETETAVDTVGPRSTRLTSASSFTPSRSQHFRDTLCELRSAFVSAMAD